MQAKNKIYQEKLKIIRPFVKIGFRNTVNFSPSQKRLITIYHRELTDSGLIEKVDGKYIQKVKFVKNKKSNIKGKPRIKGQFVMGAMPNDRLDKKGRIIKGAYLKEFIPVTFQGFATAKDERAYIKRKLQIAFKGRKLKLIDYFTIVLLGGWEFGQNMRNTTPLNERHHGRKYTKGKEKQLKIRELTEVIYHLLTTSVTRYKVQANLIIGLYHYEFKNQRKPTRKELKAIK